MQYMRIEKKFSYVSYTISDYIVLVYLYKFFNGTVVFINTIYEFNK